MKIVKMKGGLGNQMFQYAFAKFLEKELDEDVKLDFHQYKKNFNDPIRKPRILKYNISLNAATLAECEFLFPHNGEPLSTIYKAGIYFENKFNKKYFFNKGLIYQDPKTFSTVHYLDGYWQSCRYTEEVRNILLKEFTPNYKMDSSTLDTIKRVSDINSVFIGVRKGDYTQNKAMIRSWGSFDSSYYRTCMQYINSKVKNPVFFIFSNDVKWCKENLDFGGFEYYYREDKDVVDDFEELQIMAACKHAIIVNSTFNWWGAWLKDREDKIVCCPRNWYFNGQKTEILPEKWIRF